METRTSLVPETTTWICDSCHKPIERIEEGWVEYLERVDGQKPGRGLRLVHGYRESHRDKARCTYPVEHRDSKEVRCDGALKDYVGPDGLTDLLSMIFDNDVRTEEVLEMIKRLHVPGYEAARLHFDDARAEGVYERNTAPGYEHQREIARVLKFAAKRRRE